MNHLYLFLIFIMSFLLIQSASAIEVQTLVSNDSKSQTVASLPAETPKPSSFRFQVGPGITLVPAQGTLFLDRAIDRYQGGLQGNVFFRVHPRWTLELSVGYLVSPLTDIQGSLLQELVVSAGARIHLRRIPPMETKSLFVMPYLVFGPRFSILYPTVESRLPPSEEAQLRTAIYNLFTLGAYVGGGAEFRLGQHLALHADVRLGPEGVIDTENYAGPLYGSVRIFLQAGVGLTWYFR